MQVPAILMLFLASVGGNQRSPPGVNPQQYQGAQQNSGQYQQQQQYQQPQAQHHQQQQVPQQQHQQVPQQQHQQVPQQQHQQQQYQQPPPPPPPQQQQYQPAPPPPQHAHNAGNQNSQRVLHKNNLKVESDHIKEHLEVPMDTAGMSEEELQYHYFKMHDADNNNRLDGQELIKSLFHWHDADNHDPSKPAPANHPPPVPKIFQDEELINMIDPILDQDDGNRDGYIDYPEFVQAQRNAAAGSNTPSN